MVTNTEKEICTKLISHHIKSASLTVENLLQYKLINTKKYSELHKRIKELSKLEHTYENIKAFSDFDHELYQFWSTLIKVHQLKDRLLSRREQRRRDISIALSNLGDRLRAFMQDAYVLGAVSHADFNYIKQQLTNKNGPGILSDQCHYYISLFYSELKAKDSNYKTFEGAESRIKYLIATGNHGRPIIP